MVGLNFNPAIIGAGNFIDSNPDRAAPLAKIVSLKEAIEKFKSNPERQELASSNITNYSTICDVILETLGGNTNIAHINRDDVIRVREIIRHLPANAKENSSFSGLTYEDISIIIRKEVDEIRLESEKDELCEDELLDAIQELGVLRVSTINKYLTNMGTIFEFFRVNGWISLNPAEKIKINDSGYQSIREAFPDEKLIKLFNCEYNYDGVGWLPYLALYHGMRGNELAQLDIADVVQEDGVWCFNVSPSIRVSHLIALSKTVKNKKPRFVPIHSRVIERGFLDYVETRRAGGWSKIFDVTKIKSGNYLTSLASQIDEILAPVKSPQHTLHSFRHNFAQRAEKVMEDSMLKTLGGWSLPKSADERYKKGIPASQLKIEIDKISFPV
jgi:integrase